MKTETRYFHPFPEEEPEPFRLLYVIDDKGERQGHLSTKIIWDGKRFATDLAHTLLVDPDNIVGWRYLDESMEESKAEFEAVNESQGVDSEVRNVAKELTDEMLDDYFDMRDEEDLEERYIGKEYVRELHMEYEYSDKYDRTGSTTEKMPITLYIAVIMGTDEYVRSKSKVLVPRYDNPNIMATAWLQPMSGQAAGDCQQLSEGWMVPPEEQYQKKRMLYYCVRIIMESTGISGMYGLTAHELMHAKTSTRDYYSATSKAYAKTNRVVSTNRTKTPLLIPKGTTLHGIMSGEFDLSNELGKIRYYLSHGEMKSRVQETYSTIYDFAVAEDGDPNYPLDLNWAKKMILGCDAYYVIKECKEMLEKPELKEQIERWFDKELWGSDRTIFKHMTGVSTPDDFLRYLKKTLRDHEHKVIKAGYQAYSDYMEEKKTQNQ